MRTDGQTDRAKQIIAIRNFANALKNSRNPRVMRVHNLSPPWCRPLYHALSNKLISTNMAAISALEVTSLLQLLHDVTSLTVASKYVGFAEGTLC